MHIHQLYRYPVKSLGGQSVDRLRPEGRGFRDDRRWMFVDADGRFISCRSVTSLLCFAAEVHGDALRFVRIADGTLLGAVPSSGTTSSGPLSSPGEGAVAGAREGKKSIEVTVWDDTFHATLIEDEAIPAIAAELGIPGARLVYMGAEDRRPVDPRFAKPGEEVSFADGFPYLITTTASLADLSQRVGEPLDERRFRPNIVVEANEPFAEDHWPALTIGQHHFRLPKPCARCSMITVAPETGEKNLRVLAELSAYRKTGNKVMFGMNACWEGGVGEVLVGDEVRV